jgi:acetylornithine deacetylase/succinyl-diaminopimelate desuccinylase-like protein
VEGSPPSSDGGELLLWDVHQDTVPVDGMTIAPFGGEVRAGRVYGRGACDVKGSMAAMLAALSRVVDEGPGARPTIVLACTANEECGFTGAKAVSGAWYGDSPEERKVLPRSPDAAIVAEPTELDVVVAHHGVVRWRCHTLGRAAHTSRPDDGLNAIYAMAQVVQEIGRYQSDFLKKAPVHPLCGRPSVCVSTIRGGISVNTVPDHATIEIDRRLGPGEQPAAAYGQLINHIAEHASVGECRIEHEPPFMESVGLSDERNRPLAERLVSIVCEVGRSSEVIGVPYGTDAAAIAACGVPTVVFGPGSIGQAHTADEFIAIEQLQAATEVFYLIARRGLR